MKRLTQKQQQFVASYVVGDGNASKSAREAGYSHKVARVVGCNLLQHPMVQSEIALHRLAIRRRNDVEQDQLVQMLLDLFDDPEASVMDKIDAVRQIGKMCGLYPY